MLRRSQRCLLQNSRLLRSTYRLATTAADKKAVAKKPPKLFDADLVQAHWLTEILAMIPKFVHKVGKDNSTSPKGVAKFPKKAFSLTIFLSKSVKRGQKQNFNFLPPLNSKL